MLKHQRDSLHRAMEYAMFQREHSSPLISYQITMIFMWFLRIRTKVQLSPITTKSYTLTPKWKKEYCNNLSSVSASTTSIGPDPSRYQEYFNMQTDALNSIHKFYKINNYANNFKTNSILFEK